MLWPSLWIAFVLGIVQGLSEFLPISSSGHLILVGHLLGFTGPRAALFDVVVQLGAILAVVVLFWRRLIKLVPLPWPRHKQTGLTWRHLVVALCPTAAVGSLLYPLIKQTLFTPHTLIYGLLAGSLLLVFAERLKQKPSVVTLDAITYWQAALIGCFQCLALWPGFSRSGATLAGGLLMGLQRTVALEFSFIMAVPTLLGASGLDLFKSRHHLEQQDLLIFIVGFSTAFLTALFVIRAFLTVMQRVSLIPFALYRLFLALALYGLFYHSVSINTVIKPQDNLWTISSD